MFMPVSADYARIHALEYELGFRDDAPAGGAQSHSALASVLKEIWTDDYAASIAGPGTRIAAHPHEPLQWVITTDGHDEYTTVHITPEAVSHPSFATAVSLEFDAALNAHRARLAPPADPTCPLSPGS